MSDTADRLPRRLLLATLAALLITGGTPAVHAAAQEHKYVGFKKCRSCHKKVDIGNQMAQGAAMMTDTDGVDPAFIVLTPRAFLTSLRDPHHALRIERRGN